MAVKEITLEEHESGVTASLSLDGKGMTSIRMEKPSEEDEGYERPERMDFKSLEEFRVFLALVGKMSAELDRKLKS